MKTYDRWVPPVIGTKENGSLLSVCDMWGRGVRERGKARVADWWGGGVSERERGARLDGLGGLGRARG